MEPSIRKLRGGLGIRPSAWFNSAALAKLGWKLLKDPSNWWVKITTAKYLRRSTFFLLLNKTVQECRDLFKQGMRWIVGNGHQINFWLFNWAYAFPLLNFLQAHDRVAVNSIN